MATVTWRGNPGSWTNPLAWSSLRQPGSLDTALFAAADTSTATLAGSASVGGVVLDVGTSATLLLQGTLGLAGTLGLDDGTLDLAPGGTIEGGTVDLAGGTVVASGGVVDGAVWLGALGNGVAITAATAAATQAATGSLAVTGALTLEAGSYDGADISVSTFDTASAQIDTAASGTVTLGNGTTLFATADDPLHEAQVAPTEAGLTLGGSGSFVNAGTIVSDLAAAYVPLAIEAAGFVNTGTLALDVAMVPDIQQTFTVSQGRIPQQVTLTFDQTLAPGLLEQSASFDNTGTILGQAASMDVTGASFANSGLIDLGTAQAQTPFVTATTAYVQTVTLLSTFDIAASVADFVNTGTIDASFVEFDDNLTLAQLGTVHGEVLFRGTLDLQGGTLDVGKLDPTGSFTFDGTVLDGTLIADGGTIDTTEATLSGVTVLDQAPGVVLDVLSGDVVLNAATTELAYTIPASVSQLSVVAGALGVTDLIGVRAPGTLSFGAATTISDTVAGSTLEIGGAGTFSDDGSITLDAATLGIGTLDGTGTISLADGAALQVGSLAGDAAPTIAFGSGNNLLSLPDDASGANALGLILAGLQPGDVIDFAGLSSNPPIGQFGNPGAGVQNGTLDVQSASGAQASVALAGSAAGLGFAVTSDATGGTLVTVTCFRGGTRIATPSGEIPVERLRIGDSVLTAAGAERAIKWIGRRRYDRGTVAAHRQLRPVRLSAGSLGPGVPRRNLDVSPLHAMLLRAPDGAPVLVPAACLVNGRTIRRAPVAAVSYFHIELDSHDAVLAEGAAAETFVDCDSRGLFDNAAEFSALYPDHVGATWQSCEPRVEDGWLLEAIRATLPGAAAPPTRGAALRWHIDSQTDGKIEGWALHHDDPAAPVELELTAGGEQIACLVANRYRIDLDHAGLREGACGFSIALPALDRHLLAAMHLRTLAGGTLLAR